MKRLLLSACLALCATPFIASAHNQNWKPINENGDKDGKRHRWMGATEMAFAGFGVAATLGVGGYLVLRKRNTAKSAVA